ncbi:MAG: response regulator, partial [Actinomycetes bacterium]
MTSTDEGRDVGVRALRILVVDDHRSFAELLSLALGSEPDLHCVGIAASGREAITLAQELTPDIVVMDIEMPKQDGLATTRRLREVLPRTIIVMVTAHRDPQWV